jgi:hypothetical protein
MSGFGVLKKPCDSGGSALGSHNSIERSSSKVVELHIGNGRGTETTSDLTAAIEIYLIFFQKATT